MFENKLVFLHGFLGCPEDWEGVISYLPDFDCQALSYPFEIPTDGIVVGYSMGGRIALRASQPKIFQPKILLAAHPGLQTSQEKNSRWLQDKKWIDRLLSEPFSEFLTAWYAQPLFDTLRSHPRFSDILSRRLQEQPEALAAMLKQESLAHQPFTFPSYAVFLHGELDLKYAQLYRSLKIPSLEIPGAGHAAHLENPAGCADAIRKAAGLLAKNEI